MRPSLPLARLRSKGFSLRLGFLGRLDAMYLISVSLKRQGNCTLSFLWLYQILLGCMHGFFGTNKFKANVLVVCTMAKPRWFVVWDCECGSRNVNNKYAYDYPARNSMRYFCRGCDKFARMTSSSVKLLSVTQSTKKMMELIRP